MNEDFDQDQPVSDISIADLKPVAVPPLNNVVGIFRNVKVGKPKEDTGNQYVSFTFEYPLDAPADEREKVYTGFNFNQHRNTGRPEDLEGLKPGQKRQVNDVTKIVSQLREATGAMTFSQLNDKIAICTFGPHWSDVTQYTLKNARKYEAPEED